MTEWREKVAHAPTIIKPPLYQDSQTRMHHVAVMAEMLSWAKEENARAPFWTSEDDLAVWQAHYEHAVEQYTDPFGVKTYA